MPLAFRLDRESHVIVAAGYGTLTDQQVFDYQHQIASREDTIGYDELVDVTHVKEIASLSTDRLRELAAVTAAADSSRESSRLAIVAPGDLAFALSRMFQTHRELDARSRREVGVFRTTKEALAFLRIDHPLPLPKPD
jgi:precorrin-3B methylase